MALRVLDSVTVAAIRAAMASQTAQRDALVAAFGGGNVDVLYKRADNTTVEIDTHGPLVPDSNTPRGFTLGPLLASTVNISGQTVTHAVYRNASGGEVYRRDAADLNLVSPTTLTGRRINGADAVQTKQLVTALASLPVTSAVATAFTLSLSASSGTNGTPITVTVTPNGPIPTGGASVTLAASNGGTLGTTSLSFTSGSIAAQTTTLTRAVDGTSTITMTNSTGLTNNGSPTSYTSSALTWAFADGAAVAAGRNTTITLATNVPAGATVYASPDLPAGVTLGLIGGTLSAVGDSTVPTINGSSAGSVLDLVSLQGQRTDAGWKIEVMDSPYARARNLRYPLVYWGHDEPADSIYGLPEGHARLSNVLSAEYGSTPCLPGDIIEISPGAVADASQAVSFDGTGSYMHITCSLTLRNMTGRGRWRMLPDGVFGGSEVDGITIHRPAACLGGARPTVVIEGFEIDNLGLAASHVRMRNDASVNGSYANMPLAVTLRNFKIGTKAGRASLSGVSGSAETLLLEDGHVYDCGNGSGQEHNVYIGAKTMTLRGLRLERTRGWVGAPWAGGSVGLEGHIAKVSAVTGVVEGCAFVCAPLGDQSLLLQMKAGGNWTVRGNLFRDSAYPNNANGAIMMSREMGTGGPNYEWWAGVEGNSLTFERNVWIGHYPRPIFYFFLQTSDSAIRPAAGGAWTTAERLASFVVRDNIAMVASSAQGAGGIWVIGGFPGVNNAKWINNDPNGGTDWAARGNTVETYSLSESAFNDRELLLHTRAAGPVAADGGAVSTRRFVWPHGSMARSDALRGLG